MIAWPAVRRYLEAQPVGTECFIPRGTVPHPRDAGAVLSVGLPRGQRADWRFPAAADLSGLHVHEFRHGWAAHLDRVHPDRGVVPHLQADAPGVLLLVGALAGVLLGRVVARPTTGLLFGLALGAALVAGGHQQLRLRR